MRVAHAVRPDLADRTLPVDERVAVRDAVRPVTPVAGERVDPQDLAERVGQVLRVVALHPVAAVAGGDVEQSVVLVAGLGGRVEVDLLDRVDLTGEVDAHHLPAGAFEGVGTRVGGVPLGDDADGAPGSGVGLRREGRGLGEAAEALGVSGVEEAVLLELGVEGDEPGAAAEPGTGPEVDEVVSQVEVLVLLPVVDQVHRSVEVGDVHPARAVGDLTDEVDAVVAYQALVGGGGVGLGLGKLGDLLEDEAEAAAYGLFGDGVGDGLAAGEGSTGRERGGE